MTENGPEDSSHDVVLHQTLMNLEIHHNQIFWGQTAVLLTLHGFMFSALPEFPTNYTIFLSFLCCVGTVALWRMMTKNSEDRTQNRWLRNAIEAKVLGPELRKGLEAQRKPFAYISFSASPIASRKSLWDVTHVNDLPYVFPIQDNKTIVSLTCYSLFTFDLCCFSYGVAHLGLPYVISL